MLIATAAQVFLADEAGHGEPVPLRGVEAPAAIDESANLAVAWLRGGQVILLRPGIEALRLTTDLAAEVRCLRLLREEPLVMLVGTDPARVYRVTGDGSAEPLAGFDRVEGHQSWTTPWGGPAAVRCLADGGGCLYADIHVGSIARSCDGGDTWEPVDAVIHPDVHQVATCPAAPARLYANTADAVWVSDDRGGSWRHCAGGLAARYGRAIAVHPDDPDLLLASMSRGPDGQEARLYRSEDGGGSWRHLTDGLPPFVDRNIDTFGLAFGAEDAADRAFAALGEALYRSDDRGRRWRRAWTAPEAIVAVACARRL